MAVWHLVCYKASRPDSKATGFPAKYAGPSCATCHKPIEVGQTITWSRRFGKKDGGGHVAPDHRPEPIPEVIDAPEAPEEDEPEAAMTPAPPVVAPVSVAVPAGTDSAIANLLAAAVLPTLMAKVDAAIIDKVDAIDPMGMAIKVAELVRKELGDITVRRLEVSVAGKPAVDVGRQHKQFDLLVKCLAARTNVWLAGPAGSGKTSACIAAAKALGLEFRYTGAVGDPYPLTGYNDAHGKYVRTPFRDAWETGGLFLWDEVDASDPNALLAFNAALANGHAAFPDGIIPRHPDCVLVAAANTWGHGATCEYVGRLKLDAAFLDRFVFLPWEYDEALERATAGNPEWVGRVQQVRALVRDKGIRVPITPRASYAGAKLLACGLEQSQVEALTLRKGMTDEQWSQVSR